MAIQNYRRAAEHDPDLIQIDLYMKSMTGTDASRRLKSYGARAA